MMADTVAVRRYERGENRMKHVGRNDYPEITTVNGEVVGLCPTRFPEDRRKHLLEKAIPYIVSPPYSKNFPKRLFAVDKDGTIYTAQTTNPGDSYHGYPYAGQLGKKLEKALRQMAKDLNCENMYDKWLSTNKKHIRIGGKPDL